MGQTVTLFKRSAVLGFSNFAGQAILFLSPIVLVRLLSISDFGKYREFMLYATILVSALGFCVTNSLPYFIPRYPDRTKVFATQTVLVLLLSSLLGVISVGFAADYLRSITSFDFVRPLQIYILVTLNFDFLEMYWLALRQPANLLYYATARLSARVVAIITAAAMTRKVEYVIWALILVEALRLFLVLAYSFRRRMFSRAVTKDSLVYQASYFLPLGAGALVFLLNDNVGRFLISLQAGVQGLAIYTIGGFGLPIVGIVRGGIGEAVFPEMTGQREMSDRDRLRFWRGATVAYAALLFPVAGVCTVFANQLIGVLFTSQYSASAPVFIVFAGLMVVNCFEFHLPLRAVNQNRYYLIGSGTALCVNAALLVPLYRLLGITGPAFAFVLSQIAMSSFLAYRTMRAYGLSVAELVPWGPIARIGLAATLSTLPSIYLKTMSASPWTILVLGGFVYGLAYLAATHFLGVWRLASVTRLFAEARRRSTKGTAGS